MTEELSPTHVGGEVFDLDALERDATPSPFVVRVGGEDFRFPDPQDMDWKKLNQLDELSEYDAVKQLLGEEQFERFIKHDIPVWKFGRLTDQWYKHYDLPTAGEDAASSPSSNGSAARSKRTSRSTAGTSRSSGGNAGGASSST